MNILKEGGQSRDHLCSISRVSLARIRTTCCPLVDWGPSELLISWACPLPHMLSELQPPRARTPNIEVPEEKVQLSHPAFCQLKKCKSKQLGGEGDGGGPGALLEQYFLLPTQPDCP